MTPSKEQLAFYRWIEKGSGNCILESCAGSGKTTTIVECLDYIDDSERILAMSFTKLAASQLDNRIRSKGYTNVTSSTLNSVGYSICRANVKNIQVDTFKTSNILKEEIYKVKFKDSRVNSTRVIQLLDNPVRRTIGLLKNYASDPRHPDPKSAVEHIINYHSIELPDGSSIEAQAAREMFHETVWHVYMIGLDIVHKIDYDDMKLLPVIYGWQAPKYDKIFCDEAQDDAEVDIRLIELLQKSNPPTANNPAGCRVIFVGDTMQAIYLFRGALLDAMGTIRERFNCHYLTLSVCWRLADGLIEEPKKISSLITSPVPNPKGKGISATVSTPEFLEQVRIGDYVLARTTAPLVKRCLDLIKRNTPAMVKGREVGKSLLKLIDKIAGSMLDFDGQSSSTLIEFIERLQEYQATTVANLVAAKKDDSAIRVDDECEGLLYFCMEASNVDGVAAKIEALFTDADSDDSIVLLMSIHRSKGLERDRVWLLRPDLLPHPKSKTPHDLKSEERLKYVALTRGAMERYTVTKERDEK